jgi:hypothetical protein
VVVAIIVLTTALAALATFRWGWKALSLVLLIGLLTPAIASAVVGAVVYLIDIHSGEAGGFLVHASSLILFLGLPSALIPFGVVLMVRSKVG